MGYNTGNENAVHAVAPADGSSVRSYASMSTVSRPCSKCKLVKPLSAFYAQYDYRTPDHPPTEPGHVNSECMDCMKERGKKTKRIHPTVPRALTEAIAIEYLTQHGIHALPGKAVHAADVDIVAWGGVWIEVKYAQLTTRS